VTKNFLTKLNYSEALRRTQLHAVSYKHQYIYPVKVQL